MEPTLAIDKKSRVTGNGEHFGIGGQSIEILVASDRLRLEAGVNGTWPWAMYGVGHGFNTH
jgi:hypothetical protein